MSAQSLRRGKSVCHPFAAVVVTPMLLLGNGDGTFQAAQSYAAGSILSSVAIADFNRDGHPDLAVANADFLDVVGTVSVLVGKGGGSFQAPHAYAVYLSFSTSVAVGVSMQLFRNGRPARF